MIAAGGLLLAAGGAFADEQEDEEHDQARELLEHGQIHSLNEILQSISRSIDGEVVSVELTQINNRWVYRLQIVAPDGRRTFVDIEANADVDLEDREDD
jgi:uncharacterized membrane protein YkoI